MFKTCDGACVDGRKEGRSVCVRVGSHLFQALKRGNEGHFSELYSVASEKEGGGLGEKS